MEGNHGQMILVLSDSITPRCPGTNNRSFPTSTDIRSLNRKPPFPFFSHFSLFSLCSPYPPCAPSYFTATNQPTNQPKQWNSTPQSHPLTFPHLGTSPSPSSCSTATAR